MSKFSKLSRAEMRNVLGGVEDNGADGLPDCQAQGCGDGIHACTSQYYCGLIDCKDSSGKKNTYHDCKPGSA